MKKLIAGAAVALALIAAAVAGAETTFTDPAGDSGTGPDVTSVVVSDDAAGNITWRVSIANQPTLAADAEFGLVLDTDRNVATGLGGIDYVVILLGRQNAFGVARWNGSTLETAPATTFRVSYTANVLQITGNRSELGNTSGFSFFLLGSQVDASDNIIAEDEAPDGESVWDYTLTSPPPPAPPPPPPPPLSLTAGKPSGNPAKPKAGKAFVVSVPVRRSDTRGPLTVGGVTCKATVGGNAVRASGRFGTGRPQCVVRIPKATKGKMVRGSLTVRFQGKTVTKTFSFRVT